MHARRIAFAPAHPIRLVPGKLVGRAAELSTLRAALDEAHGGKTRMVLIEGVPGMGKSRLLDAVVALAETSGAQVRRARCYEGDGAPRLWPWTRVLRSEIGTAPVTFDLMAVALQGLVESACGQPLVVVLDDLHAADESTLRLLEFIVRTVEGEALAVVGAYRPSPEGSVEALLPELLRSDSVCRLTLAALGCPALADLALDLLGRQLSTPQLVELDRRSGGNPWIAREMLVALRALATPTLPGVVHTALARRMSSVSPQCRALLSRLLADTSLDAPGDRAAVNEGSAAGLIVDAGDHVRFASGAAEEAAREVLGAARSTEPEPRPLAGSLIRLDGHYWTLDYGGRVVRLRDVRGMRYLALLLRHPGRDFHVVELTEAVHGAAATTCPPVESGMAVRFGLGDAPCGPDARAFAAYRRRVADLRGALADAEAAGDTARVSALSEELAALSRELARGHRGRSAAVHVERARIAVTKALRHALELITRAHPDLGRHLRHTVRRGTSCVYAPDPRLPIDWRGDDDVGSESCAVESHAATRRWSKCE